MKDISMMKGRMAEPLMECNGFCGPKDAPVQPKSDPIGKIMDNVNFDQ